MAVVVSCALAFSDRAHASHVGCGDTITADTTLDSDLVNCPNNGIVIGANNVTLDLNGHTVDGDGELVDPCPGREHCDVGVVNEGHHGTTIKGGRVQGFELGVGVFDARDVVVRQLTASVNDLGAFAVEVRDARLRRLDVSHNIGIGILLFRAAHSAVSRSTANANGLNTDEAGMAVFESHHVKLKRNSISHNGDIGVVSSKADALIAKQNTLTDNPELGLLLDGDRNEIAGNRLVRNGEGIGMTGNHNVITRNHVVESGVCSHVCAFGFAIDITGGDHNLIAHNKVRGATRDGINVGLPFAGHVRHTKVVGNRVRDVSRDGVRVGKRAVDTLLRRNRAVGADDDGIDVRRASTTVIGNHAVQNHDLGIDAVSGVTNGGGNRASGNGDSRQCVNVNCQ